MFAAPSTETLITSSTLGVEMAKNYPPDGCGVGGVGTVWGSNIDHDGTVYKTGSSSVKITDDIVGGNPYMRDLEYYPCAAGDLFRGDGWLRADSVAGGNTVKVMVWWYTGAEVFISASTIHNDVLGAINTWEFKSAVVTAPATAAYFRYHILKTNNAFNAWFDSVEIHRMLVSAHVSMTGNQVMAAGTTQIQYDSEDYDYGSNFNPAAANYSFTAPADGLYSVTLNTEVIKAAAPTVGMFMYTFVDLNAAAIGFACTDNDTTAMLMAGPTYRWYGNFSDTLLLNAGDVLKAYITHTDAANLSIQNGQSYFAVSKVE